MTSKTDQRIRGTAPQDEWLEMVGKVAEYDAACELLPDDGQLPLYGRIKKAIARAAAPAVGDAPRRVRKVDPWASGPNAGEDATPRTPLRDLKCGCDESVGYICNVHAKDRNDYLDYVDLLKWLEERRENCLRLMEQKTGEERLGWLEDSEYFRMAIAALRATTPQPRTECPHCNESYTTGELHMCRDTQDGDLPTQGED